MIGPTCKKRCEHDSCRRIRQGDAIVALECGHEIRFSVAPPKNGTRVWCFGCDAYRVVSDGVPDWNVRCKGCRLHRAYGVARLTAERAAARHMFRKPTHTVFLMNGRTIVQTFTPSDTPLDMEDCAPPF